MKNVRSFNSIRLRWVVCNTSCPSMGFFKLLKKWFIVECEIQYNCQWFIVECEIQYNCLWFIVECEIQYNCQWFIVECELQYNLQLCFGLNHRVDINITCWGKLYKTQVQKKWVVSVRILKNELFFPGLSLFTFLFFCLYFSFRGFVIYVG